MSVSIMQGIQAQMSVDCDYNADECWCRGSGWILSDWDTFHTCHHHYKGQPNNESPEWEWDMWLSNHEGDGQFMVIPNEVGDLMNWEHKAKQLAWAERDLPF